MSTATISETGPLHSLDELRARLEAIGEQRYHHRHKFHQLMHEGKLNREQLQAWALNRYYYQSRIPIKDALILARIEDPTFRRLWRKRIEDHDGTAAEEGGIARWLSLAEATGLSREQVSSERHVLPGVRYAVNEYLRLVQQGSLLQAVATSLTELFAGRLITLRVDRMQQHYPWMSHGLSYFEARKTQAPADAASALAWLAQQAKTREHQEQICDSLRAKCDLLWAQLDAIYFAYVEPGWIPPSLQGDPIEGERL